MDMMGTSNSMGGMSMGDGVPGLFYMQQMYWKVVGSAIAFAFAANVFHKALAIQRVHTGSARPRLPLMKPYATSTAIIREITYASLVPLSIWRWKIHFLPVGRIIILLANLVVVIILCFYKLDPSDQWKWEDVGYRTGFIGLAQLPLIFLLASKKNIIGALTGFSYERLNYLHRWTARTLWLTITIHMSFWFRDWARYDYITIKLTTDPITQKGFAAWCILTFIVFTSFAPIRKWNYELFVITHLVTFAGFIGAVWIHVPKEVKAWVWIPIGLFAFDRLMRARRIVFSNFKRHGYKMSVGYKATLTALPGNVTRITINDPLITWKPGQHVFLSCHSIVPLQSHPFTITSLPSDQKMEFIVRAERGGTKRLLDFASSHENIPLTVTNTATNSSRTVLIEGPYGKMRPLRQFDTIVLLAGSTGANFTMPLMRDIVHNWRDVGRYLLWSDKRALNVVRRIRFVWVTKARDRISWFQDQIDSVKNAVNSMPVNKLGHRLKVDISVYITCDETFTKDQTDASIRERTSDHGRVEEMSSSNSSTENLEKEKEFEHKSEVISVHSASPSSDAEAGDPTCGPNGTCCCTRTVSEDASASSVPECSCHCDSSNNPSKGISAPPTPNSIVEPALSPTNIASSATITTFTGRPAPESIIRRSLEAAEGETAVVVCGPRGLREEVRRSVVKLSDERAVHKGTGAQGVWLHSEGFEV